MIPRHLKHHPQALEHRTQIFATQDANICNLTCKRYHPRTHTFICFEKSPPHPYFYVLETIFTGSSKTQTRDSTPPETHFRTDSKPISAVKSMNFLHKREQMCNVPLSFERKRSTTGSVILTPQMPFQRHITTAHLQLNNPKSIPFCPQLTIY